MPCSGVAYIRLPLAEREGYIEEGYIEGIDTQAGNSDREASPHAAAVSRKDVRR